MSPDIAKLLEALKAKVPDLRLVMLFGSFACGRERGDSDIDLALAAEKPLSSLDMFHLKMDIQIGCSRAVDLIDLGNMELSFVLKYEIVTTGKAIFEADDRVLSQFESQIFRDYHDFLFRRREIDEAVTKRLSQYANA